MKIRRLFFFALTAITVGCSSFSSNTKKSEIPDHIVIVMNENKNFDQIIGNPDAPYINALSKKGLLFTDSHGVAHPSQPNYIALFSGSTQGVKDDRCLKNDSPFTTPNLGNELITNGYRFAGYSETMPETGFNGCGEGKSSFSMGSSLYARKHNPWVNWQGQTPTGIPDSVNLTLEDFPSDYSKLPTVAFVIPNEDNDMHNGPDSLTISRGDAWLKNNMDGYIKWAKNHNSLFILTYDEDHFRKRNHIVTIFAGDQIKPGRYDSTINHYNVLRTIENWYHLPKAGPATEKTITGVWRTGKTEK